MCELQFFNKNTGKKNFGRNNSYDIKVSISKSDNRGMYISFVNYAYNKISETDQRIEVAPSGSRLYFRINDADGYKLQCGGPKHKDGSRYLHFPRSYKELTEWAETYAGKYELLYDFTLGLYCIDANGVVSKL